MIQVLHIIDDEGLGGVNRVLGEHMTRMRCRLGLHRVCLKATRPVMPELAGIDVAVVHFTVSWFKMPFLLALQRKMAGRPVIIVEHTYTRQFERHCVEGVGRFHTLLRLAYGTADCVVAVSEAQARWLRDIRVLPMDRLHVIRQALDFGVMERLPLPVRGPGPLRLGAYGRYVRQKGFDTLIEAMRAIAPGTATLRLAGYGPGEATLRAAASALPHVTIEGAVDPAAFLAEVDASAFPSRWEAFGIVAAESRAAGRPVIAGDVDGFADQLAAWPELLFPPDDPEVLRQRILWLAAQDLASWARTMRHSAAGALERHDTAWMALLTASVHGGMSASPE